VTTNANLSQKLSAEKVKEHRRYTSVSLKELKSIFFARMDMISRGSRTVDEAYKVRPFFSVALHIPLTATI
jgi:hypothetical protein